MRRLLFFFVMYITIAVPGEKNFYFRRIKSPAVISDNISIFTSQGSAIGYTWKHFPDGEIYIRLHNPQEIKGREVILEANPGTREDFLRLLFLTSTIAEYQPLSIKVKFQSWVPQNPGEEAMLSALAHFGDKIQLSGSVQFSFYTRTIIPTVSKFDDIIYLKPEFKKYAHALGEKFNARVVKVNTVLKSSTHWQTQLPEDMRGKDILILHSTRSGDDILNLISTLYLLKENRVRSITVCNTYQGYARQDKVFNPGEGITGYALLKVLNTLCDYNITVNVHFGEKSGEVKLKDEGVYNLNGFSYLARGVFDHILEDYSPKELNGKTLVLLAPDDGSFNYVKEAIQDMKEYLEQKGITMDVVGGYLNKTRISSHRVVVENNILGEGGEEVDIPKDAFFIILDDETSTGMTVKVATYHLVSNLGFNWWHIYAGIVHGKFVKGIQGFFTEGADNIPPRFIASLDTLKIPAGIKVISIYPLLLDSLTKFLNTAPLPVPE